MVDVNASELLKELRRISKKSADRFDDEGAQPNHDPDDSLPPEHGYARDYALSLTLKQNFQNRFLKYKYTLLSCVPILAALMCAISFFAPFAMLFLKAWCPAFVKVDKYMLMTLNVPLLGIAGTIMALFLRATNNDKDSSLSTADPSLQESTGVHG